MNVVLLVGSSRRESFNARLAQAAVEQLHGASVTVLDPRELPFYDEDVDAAGQLGDAVDRFRGSIAAADALVVVSPAYNGSMAGSIKNAIDVASRPRGAASLLGKPAAVLCASANPRAGVGVVEHITTALRIAGAAPVGDGLATTLHGAFPDGVLAAGVRDAVATLMADLAAAVAGGEAGQPAA